MLSLSSVLIFLVANCLTRATATDDFLTGKPVTVTPFNGTHLKLDYKDAVKIDDYNEVHYVVLDIDESERKMFNNPKGDPFLGKAKVCKTTTGKLKFDIDPDTKKVKFSYKPLEHFEKHFTACMKDGDLEINVGEKNALNICFSESSGNSIQLLEPKLQTELKLGSNNITLENITSPGHLKFKIEIDGQTKELQRNNTESCVKLTRKGTRTETEAETGKGTGMKTPPAIWPGILCGIIVLVVFGVISTVVIRKRMTKPDDEEEVVEVVSVVEDNPHYGETDYETGDDAVVTDTNPDYQ